MIVKSNGVILNYIKYGESSIIARVLTEELGYGSFIVQSIRSQRSKKSIGHFQPFSILELVLHVKETRELQRVSDFRNHIPIHHIHQDLIKGTITLFLTEVMSKLFQSEQAPNQSLYAFVVDSIRQFDGLTSGSENFHLQFLLKIASYLGFAIDEYDTVFTSMDKLVPHAEGEHVLEKLITEPYGLSLEVSRDTRNEVLDLILDYYGHHANLRRPNSLTVLRNILS